jgi:hypothetical protein
MFQSNSGATSAAGEDHFEPAGSFLTARGSCTKSSPNESEGARAALPPRSSCGRADRHYTIGISGSSNCSRVRADLQELVAEEANGFRLSGRGRHPAFELVGGEDFRGRGEALGRQALEGRFDQVTFALLGAAGESDGDQEEPGGEAGKKGGGNGWVQVVIWVLCLMSMGER